MNDRKLSTLEHTVLGLAWLRGPRTIYSIMKELSLSASSFHKSRAGTAYSVANRLLKFGLLESLGDERVVVTEAGRNALREWVAPPVPMTDVAHSADLLRLRFFFLGVVDPAERLAFIDEAIAGLQVFERQCVNLIADNQNIGDYFGALATVSSVIETRGRIAWLRLARGWVVEPMPAGSDWCQRIVAALDG
ncbi:MAG TPA: PadR family transcriptional regulator [Fimbriimonadaceae bacterium]|nr:PadR family transcriptional regulator [Fimbriimonadaceae bacterium]